MKKKILFVFNNETEEFWQDGLWRALQLLSFDYEITLHNLYKGRPLPYEYDFILGWGAFQGNVDKYIRSIPAPRGLCIAGTGQPTEGMLDYDVLFYETDWYRSVIQDHPNIVKAFGINTDIFKPMKRRKFWDYTTVGAFASWKRQHLLLNKSGNKLAVGEIQKGNPQESGQILSVLLRGGVWVSDNILPKSLCEVYNMSKVIYQPADIFGGGERVVLEAKACGIPVEIEDDNPKLKELVDGPVLDYKQYAEQLRLGIGSVL